MKSHPLLSQLLKTGMSQDIGKYNINILAKTFQTVLIILIIKVKTP